MTGLTLAELRKRNNFEILLKKIRTKQEIKLTNKKRDLLGIDTVVIKPQEGLLLGLEKMAQDPDGNALEAFREFYKNNMLHLETEGGKLLTSGALQKTWEFGSKTAEMVYAKEKREQKNISETLKKLTVFGMRPITLLVNSLGGKTFRFENIVSITNANKKTGKSGKVDFEFLDKEGNVVFTASHKYGNRPRHFRQWAGFRDFASHPELVAFGEDLKTTLENQYPGYTSFPKGVSFGREISDPTLKRLAIFGKDGEVDFVIQGRCSFVPTQNPFEFVLSAHMIISSKDDLSSIPKQYEPVILARRSGTDIDRAAFGIKGCRGMLYPRNGRLVHVYI